MKKLPPNAGDLEHANKERQRGAWQRGQALTRLKTGQTTIPELIRLAKHHRHLRALRLDQLLQTSPDTPRRIRKHWWEKTTRLTGYPCPKDATVGWLLDRRDKNDTRIQAFLEVLNTSITPPWSGWPYTPKPQQERKS